MKAKAIAVLISDIHYNLNTLPLADAAMRQAIDKANSLPVPLIVAGDLHDTKANLRGECVNAMLETFKLCKSPPYIMIGNHCRINEKAPEHALNFLSQYGMLIEKPTKQNKFYLLPYYHDPEELKAYLKTLPKGATLVMHQGLSGTASGEYIQDKSAITPNDVAGFRVISGHYHTRQTIQLPNGGQWDYIGNPYTLNYGEANDPLKGYQILMSDGSLEFVPTNLRKHVVYTTTCTELYSYDNPPPKYNQGDLIKVKVSGTKEELAKLTKDGIGEILSYPIFKLELLPTTSDIKVEAQPHITQHELLDSIINSTNSSEECKIRLKETWRGMCS